ncbi:MAG: hypothetical protein GQE15_13830 [Archangiaceae bacterium]|nr:hypothetical protein [Archangiaceae bacterium]
MPERRKSDRRSNPAVPEPLERKKERRQGDRRDSLRKKSSFVVRDGTTRHDVDGELGLGGASFTLPGAPQAASLVVELRLGKTTLQLPGTVTEARVARTAVRHVHLQFAELDTRTELTLAKWLDDVE